MVCFGYLSHINQHHRGDFLWLKLLVLAFELDLDLWLSAVVVHLERQVLNICLNCVVVEAASDQALDVEDCVLWVDCDLGLFFSVKMMIF